MKNKIDFAVGGQAVIEGVMMRSPNFVVTSVRKESGKIKSKKESFVSAAEKWKIFKAPILRGMLNLVEMLRIGYRALNYSAMESIEESPKEKHEKTFKENMIDITAMIFSIVFALFIGLFLFKFLPLSIAEFLSQKFSFVEENYIVFNIIDGLTKTIFFILYIWIISLFPTFKRVFRYHGAEHKAIFVYEKNLPFTVANARIQSRFHPRCGTSFIFIVFMISILVYTLVPKLPEFYQNLSLRILLLPLIAGIAYEALKLSSKHSGKWWVSMLILPGLLFQKITTEEPDDSQLEIALNSLESALEAEKTLTQVK